MKVNYRCHISLPKHLPVSAMTTFNIVTVDRNTIQLSASLSHARVMLINLLSHFITELKIHCLYSLITTRDDFDSADPSRNAGRLSHMNSVKWPCFSWVLVAQWIERPPYRCEIMGPIPVGDSGIFHARVMLINSLRLIRYIRLLFNTRRNWLPIYMWKGRYDGKVN